MKTELTQRARQVSATFPEDSFGREIIDSLIVEVERMNNLALYIHYYIPPTPPVGDPRDFTDTFKVKMFDQLRRAIYKPHGMGEK